MQMSLQSNMRNRWMNQRNFLLLQCSHFCRYLNVFKYLIIFQLIPFKVFKKCAVSLNIIYLNTCCLKEEPFHLPVAHQYLSFWALLRKECPGVYLKNLAQCSYQAFYRRLVVLTLDRCKPHGSIGGTLFKKEIGMFILVYFTSLSI